MVKKIIYSSIIVFLFHGALVAQELTDKKTWVSGYARSILLNDDYENQSEADTISAKKIYSGHTLLDLGLNMKTNKDVFIHGEIRVRNDHGGFWGSGVSFDLRNLYLRGVVSNAFRYQIGDVNYKLTPYTFFNADEEFSSSEPKIFGIQREMNRHDLFYTKDNTWRQQGATGEFGLTFKKYIKTMDFNMFTTRLLATEGGGSPERLFAGASINLKQSKHIDAQLTYVETFEIEGTGTTEDSFGNNVLSGGVGLHQDFENWKASVRSEFGQSKWENVLSDDELILEDHFSDVSLNVNNKENRLDVNISFQDVGSGFRSIGAQTKRINFGASPRAYSRYGNEQNVRTIGFLDMLRDASLYNSRLSTTLMAYNPAYGNFQPYGKATPNRRSMAVDAGWSDENEFIGLKAKLIMGTEVVGEGTTELRDFNTINAKVEFHVDELFDNIKKDIDLQVEYWGESTERSGESEFENVNLANDMLSVGVNIGLWNEFELLFGFRSLNSVGNEYSQRKTLVGELITFTPYELDFSEQVISTGLRYNFSDKSMLNLQWMSYDADDKLEVSEDYTLSNWSVIYQIKF
ncbi:MAG: hypothetical protein ACI8XB_001804 [Patiriisocius sp.]|jgi:hypothetical protein